MSWLNMVETFFGIITRQATRRGTLDSVRDFTSLHRDATPGDHDVAVRP